MCRRRATRPTIRPGGSSAASRAISAAAGIGDIYGEHGVNKNNQHLFHNVVSTFLNYALDAVRTPGGQIVCGVTIPGRVNPNTGAPYTADDVAKAAAGGACTPLNLFGVGNASQAGIDYAFRTLVETSTYKQDVVSANLRANSSRAGARGRSSWPPAPNIAASMAASTMISPISPGTTPTYTLSYGLDYAGTIRVIEGYTELNVPVLRDVPFARYIELDGAIRQTSNKNTQTLGAQQGQSKTSRLHHLEDQRHLGT